MGYIATKKRHRRTSLSIALELPLLKVVTAVCSPALSAPCAAAASMALSMRAAYSLSLSWVWTPCEEPAGCDALTSGWLVPFRPLCCCAAPAPPVGAALAGAGPVTAG